VWWLILTHLAAALLGAFLLSLLTMAKFADLQEDNDKIFQEYKALARQYKELLLRRDDHGEGSAPLC